MVFVKFFLLVAVCVAGTSARRGKSVEKMSVVDVGVPFVKDYGVVTNCGKSPMSGKWTPKVISASGEVTAYINITVPFDMGGGYAEVDIYKHKDGSIVAQYGTPFDCEDIKQWIPCPLKKGESLKLEKTITDLRMLTRFQDVYDITVQVTNNDDQQILCINATVTVTR